MIKISAKEMLQADASTRLAAGINEAQAVFIEMFITAALILSVLMLAAEKHNATPFAPVSSIHLFSHGLGLTPCIRSG